LTVVGIKSTWKKNRKKTMKERGKVNNDIKNGEEEDVMMERMRKGNRRRL